MNEDTKNKLMQATADLHEALTAEVHKSEPNVINLLRLQATATCHVLLTLMGLIDGLPVQPTVEREDDRQRKLFD